MEQFSSLPLYLWSGRTFRTEFDPEGVRAAAVDIELVVGVPRHVLELRVECEVLEKMEIVDKIIIPIWYLNFGLLGSAVASNILLFYLIQPKVHAYRVHYSFILCLWIFNAYLTTPEIAYRIPICPRENLSYIPASPICNT